MNWDALLCIVWDRAIRRCYVLIYGHMENAFCFVTKANVVLYNIACGLGTVSNQTSRRILNPEPTRRCFPLTSLVIASLNVIYSCLK